jgi:hypothetical protein
MQRPSSVQTEVEAKARRACIDADKGIAYTVFYDLEKGDNYQGLVQVEFYYVGGDNVFFDWTGDTLESIRVNKVTFKPEAEADKTKVKIEESYLIKDSFNIVELKYKNRYYRDGEKESILISIQMESSTFTLRQSLSFRTELFLVSTNLTSRALTRDTSLVLQIGL